MRWANENEQIKAIHNKNPPQVLPAKQKYISHISRLRQGFQRNQQTYIPIFAANLTKLYIRKSSPGISRLQFY